MDANIQNTDRVYKDTEFAVESDAFGKTTNCSKN